MNLLLFILNLIILKMFIGNSEQNFKNTENTNNDGGVKTTLNLMRLIESNDVEEVNRILENETINKNTISAALNKALQAYKMNSDMIDIVETLLKYDILLLAMEQILTIWSVLIIYQEIRRLMY
jgi:hypothetical protein